jgi:hypothetical protein
MFSTNQMGDNIMAFQPVAAKIEPFPELFSSIDSLVHDLSVLQANLFESPQEQNQVIKNAQALVLKVGYLVRNRFKDGPSWIVKYHIKTYIDELENLNYGNQEWDEGHVDLTTNPHAKKIPAIIADLTKWKNDLQVKDIKVAEPCAIAALAERITNLEQVVTAQQQVITQLQTLLANQYGGNIGQ